MAANKTTLTELGEMLAHVVEHMSTKDDIATFRKELKGDISTVGEHVANTERELKAIRRDLNDLMDQFENVVGYRKEIDHALDRIAALEKHFGIDHKIAA
jgi:archaellum component FlaC